MQECESWKRKLGRTYKENRRIKREIGKCKEEKA